MLYRKSQFFDDLIVELLFPLRVSSTCCKHGACLCIETFSVMYINGLVAHSQGVYTYSTFQVGCLGSNGEIGIRSTDAKLTQTTNPIVNMTKTIGLWLMLF